MTERKKHDYNSNIIGNENYSRLCLLAQLSYSTMDRLQSFRLMSKRLISKTTKSAANN